MDAARGRHRLGRRGRSLLFFAGLDLVYAFSLVASDRDSRPGTLFGWLGEVLPMWVWASLWSAAGLVCLWSAFQRCDRWGFVAGIAIKVLWGCVCFGAWLVGEVPLGYVSAAVWLAAAALVGNLAGWPEPGDGRGPTWIPPSS